MSLPPRFAAPLPCWLLGLVSLTASASAGDEDGESPSVAVAVASEVRTPASLPSSSEPASQTPASPRSVGADSARDPSLLPAPVSPDRFHDLMGNSPFTRSLNLSESLILTGIAHVDGKPMATLVNRETKETYVVSDQPNPQGWKMVELSPGASLASTAAKISVAGGEVLTVRFDENQLKPGEARPASGPAAERGDGRSGGDRGDGRRRGPPPEVMAKLRELSDEQRGKLREIMMKQMQKNPNMSGDERSEVFRKAVEKVTGDR